MPKVPRGDSPGRHASSHGSDHSGAHVRGTSHHRKHSSNPTDGLTVNEGGSAQPGGLGDGGSAPMPGGLPPGLPGGGQAPGGGGMPGGGAPPGM